MDKLPELLLGAILPPLVAFVNARVTNPVVKAIVSWAVCIVVGAIANYQLILNGNLEELAANIVPVLVASQATYDLYWKKSRVLEISQDINKSL